MYLLFHFIYVSATARSPRCPATRHCLAQRRRQHARVSSPVFSLYFFLGCTLSRHACRATPVMHACPWQVMPWQHCCKYCLHCVAARATTGEWMAAQPPSSMGKCQLWAPGFTLPWGKSSLALYGDRKRN
jgi:hypothetical protein